MPWHSFRQIFEHSMDELDTVPGMVMKVIIGETGPHDAGGDKAQGFTDMRMYLKDSEMRVRGVCYFRNSQDGANGRAHYPARALPPYEEMAADAQSQGKRPERR
jgi:hypothetical protein